MQLYFKNLCDFSESDLELCLCLMDEKRKEYLSSLKHQKGKNLSIAAEWLVKTNAAKILNKDIKEITIEREEKGKPFIKNTPLCISISHSGDYVAAAFEHFPVGVDIEVIRPIDIRLKKRICTESDLIFLKKSENQEEENLNLLKIWTAKEAYFKMTGSGITDFKSISYKDINCLHSFENSLIITTVT